MIAAYTILFVTFVIACIFFHWMYRVHHKNNIEFEKNTNDKFAERRKVNKQFTPIRGSWVVRVSNKQWIEVQWDKTNNYIHLILPPNTHQNRSKFPIYITRKNWHITKDLPPKEVTVEYFTRQVM